MRAVSRRVWLNAGACLSSFNDALAYSWIGLKTDYKRAGRRWSFARVRRYVRRIRSCGDRAKMLLSIRTAESIRICHHDNGLFANLLAVLDVLAHARPECKIRVDWTLQGTEKHFRYGSVGTNVWDFLFEPIDNANNKSVGQEICVRNRLNPFLISVGKDMLSQSKQLQRVRKLYGDIYRRHVRIRNPYVIGEIDKYRQLIAGSVCIGVHKRLGTPGVAGNQLSARMPTIQDVVGVVASLLEKRKTDEVLIYLATDEKECVTEFLSRFGQQVIVRPNVNRVSIADRTEVHMQDWGRVSLKDAYDVLIDAVLLASCSELIHLSSNVSTCVGFINPHIKMTHFDDVCRRN